MTNGWTSPGGDSAAGQGASPPPPQYGQYGPPGGGYPSPPPFQLAAKPGVIPLRPLNLGDIFGGTMGTIRGNPGATIGLSALMALIVAVPSVLLTIALSNADLTVTDDAGTSVNFGGQIGLVVGSVFSAIAGVLLAGMLTVVVAEAVLGRRISIGQTWQKVRGRLLPLIGLLVLVVLAVCAVAAVVVGVVVVFAVATGSAGAVIAGIVLGIGAIVGAVWLAVKVSLSAPAVVLERIGPIRAFGRSWRLTGRQWWRIFGITLLAQLIVYAISQLVSFPAALLAIGGVGSGDSDLGTTGAGVIQLVSVVVSALTTPFTAGVTALLYLDQRIRKEALDVTLMAATGGGGGKDGAGAG